MIQVQELTKSFGSKAVLKSVSMAFSSGEIVFVMGKSGVGKSVLLKHIVGLLAPDSGSIVIDGKEITGLCEDDLVSVRRNCGMIFQFPALLDSLNVYENVSFGLRSHKLCKTEEEMKTTVEKMLGLVGLTSALLDKYPQELSFGAQKRVAVARTLAVSPKYLLFDEPTTSLDPVTTTATNELIRHLSKDIGVACVVVSHDMQSAFTIADRVVMLDQGRVVYDGLTVALRDSPSPLVQAFVKEMDRYHD